MRLPMINAVSEGTLVGTSIYIFTGIVGNSFWISPSLNIEWLGITGVSHLTLGQTIMIVLLMIPVAMMCLK